MQEKSYKPSIQSLFIAILVWLGVLLALFLILSLKGNVHSYLMLGAAGIVILLGVLSVFLYKSASKELSFLMEQLSTRDAQLREALARLDELYLLVATSHSDVLPRKPFLRLVQRELGRATRIGTPLTVVGLKLKKDFPKGIGKVLRMTGRSTDYVGQDGHIFYFLLLDTDATGAKIFISRLKDRLNKEFNLSDDELRNTYIDIKVEHKRDFKNMPSPEKLLEQVNDNLG